MHKSAISHIKTKFMILIESNFSIIDRIVILWSPSFNMVCKALT